MLFVACNSNPVIRFTQVMGKEVKLGSSQVKSIIPWGETKLQPGTAVASRMRPVYHKATT